MLRRHIVDRLIDALADTPAVLVNGARQTGKSTLVQSPELTGQGRQYLTFDDPSIMAAAMRAPSGFVAGLAQHVEEGTGQTAGLSSVAIWLMRLAADAKPWSNGPPECVIACTPLKNVYAPA